VSRRPIMRAWVCPAGGTVTLLLTDIEGLREEAARAWENGGRLSFERAIEEALEPATA
jgi:hypothetical protein